MTVLLAGALLVCLASVVVLAVAFDRAHERTTDDRLEAERRWASERRELLTRVQRPDLIPVARPSATPTPQPDIPARDRMAKVGTVNFGGLRDDFDG